MKPIKLGTQYKTHYYHERVRKKLARGNPQIVENLDHKGMKRETKARRNLAAYTVKQLEGGE